MNTTTKPYAPAINEANKKKNTLPKKLSLVSSKFRTRRNRVKEVKFSIKNTAHIHPPLKHSINIYSRRKNTKDKKTTFAKFK